MKHFIHTLFALFLPLAALAFQVEIRMAPYDDQSATVEDRSWDRPKYAPVNTPHGVELKVVGRDFGSWARNVRIDDEPVFERYHDGRYVGRAPRARRDLGAGTHTIWPGDHSFTIADDGAISSDDPTLKVDGDTITILAWPVTIKALLANSSEGPLPDAMRLAPIPNLAVRDSTEQERDDAAVAAWLAEGSNGGRPHGSAKELLPAFGDFAPLTIWLPANTSGNGYRLHPIGQSFSLSPDGIAFTYAEGETAVEGIELDDFEISIPLYRFPVRGDPGTRLVTTGVESYNFSERVPTGGTSWYPRRHDYEVLAGEHAQPLRVSGDLTASPYKSIAVFNTTSSDGGQRVALVEHSSRHFKPGDHAVFSVQASSDGATNLLADAQWSASCRLFGTSELHALECAQSAADGRTLLDCAIPGDIADGVYDMVFSACLPNDVAAQATVATRVTIARASARSAGVFTPRARTAFFRGEHFWLGICALSTDSTKSAIGGAPLSLELVDPRGAATTLFSETLPMAVGSHATRIIDLAGETTLNLAAGDYVLRPSIGDTSGREVTITIVDPEPASHFTTLINGKYNSQGTEYAQLLHSGDRDFADALVNEMVAAGANGFMGMTYDLDRVMRSDSDVEQLVRERPELGPWEAWAQPSGRDKFMDACARHNLRFWENLFTYNDTSLPRGTRIRAGSARFSGLETHSMRHNPIFQGVCIYDEIYSRSGDDGSQVGNDFDTATEMEYREAYPGRTGSQAAKALERFASRPFGQRSIDDLDYARSWTAWEDEMWRRWCSAITRPVKDVAPTSRNFVLNRYWGGPGGNISANGYEAGVFAELDIAACVMYKDGGYGDRPVFAPMQADVLRIRPDMPVWTQIHDFNGPGVNGRHLLRQAFLALGQKVDGFTFFCTSFDTDSPSLQDHQWSVANIARGVCRPYGDFLLSLEKGYHKVGVYYSRTAANFGARKTASIGHQCELLWVACLRAGYPADFIRDEDLRAGRADGYAVIFAPGFAYEEECPEDILNELRRLASAGSTILVEKGSKLAVDGLVRLNSDLDEYEDRLGGSFPRYVDYETEVVFRRSEETTKLLSEVLPRYIEPAAHHDLPFGPDWQKCGDGEYLFAANFSPVGFKGLSLTLYQAPHVSHIAFTPRPPVCYDIMEMRRIDAPIGDDGLMGVDVDMRRSPGKILAFLPKEITGVRLMAPEKLSLGDTLGYAVSVTDSDGANINASFPVELTLRDSDGATHLHIWRAAAPELRAAWRLPRNLPAGEWTLEARELISGKAAIARIAVGEKTADKLPRIANADASKCWIEDSSHIREFLKTIRETEAIVPVEPGRPEVRAAAEKFVAALAAKGYKARVEDVTDVARPPAPLDPRNPQLDGTRLWRGNPVNPAQFIDAPCIVFGSREDNRLLATLIARDVFNQSPSESFPGPGRGYLTRVRCAFSIVHDTIVVAGADAGALDAATTALLAISPDDAPDAHVAGERTIVPVVARATAGESNDGLVAAQPAEARIENRADDLLGDDMVMSLDFDPATGRTLVGTYGYATNLFCLAADGALEWSAFLPEFDVYRAKWCDDGRRVVAMTGRGWYVFVLDGATGEILARSVATEWPDTHWTEGCVDTQVALFDNKAARQLLVCGRTGLLAMDYDGRKLWFHDLAPEITTYPEESEKSGSAAIFPRHARVGRAVASPDGAKIGLCYYKNIGTTMEQTKQVDLWAFRPCVLDASTGERLCISTNDPGMEMSPIGWDITWPEGSENPLVWRDGFARQGHPLAAELLPDGELGEWMPRQSRGDLAVEGDISRDFNHVSRKATHDTAAWSLRTGYSIPHLDKFSADGAEIFRSGRDGMVRCISINDAALRWETSIGAAANLLPVADGGVIAGTLMGTVVRLGADGSIAWEVDLRKLQELPRDDYPAFVRDAIIRDTLKHYDPFPSNPERPGDLDGVLRFGVEHVVNGGFEDNDGWDGVTAADCSAPAHEGTRSLLLADGRLATQSIDRRLIPVGTYLLEFMARFEDTRTRLAAGAVLGESDGGERYAMSSFGGVPGEWTFCRVAIKTTAKIATMQIGFEAEGGSVRIDSVSLRPVRFASGNLLANEQLHNVEPTFVKDIRIRYSRVPAAIKQSLMSKSRVTAYRQGPTDTGAIPTDEEAFLHNGRIDDCGSIWYYQPDAIGYSVALAQPAWVSHIVLYLNNAAPDDAYNAIAILANNMDLKVPETKALVRGNTRRFVVVPFDPPVHTDTFRILPGVLPKTQREVMTEIEVYGSLSEPSTNAVRGFPVGTNVWPMAMGGPAHTPMRELPSLEGAFTRAGEHTIWTPTFHVGGILADDLLVFGDPVGALRSVYFDPQRGVQFGRRWSLGTLTPLSTPAWYADKLFVGTFDNRLYAMAASGANLWSFKTEGRVYSSPTPDGDEVYFGSDDGRVYRVDLDSGVLLWEFETGGQVRGAVAVADGLVFAISGDGHLYAIDKERGKEVWRADVCLHTRTAPVVFGGRVVTIDEAGIARCFDEKNGAPLWQADVGSRSLISPVVTTDVPTAEGAMRRLAVFPTERGIIAAYALDDGAPAWRRDLGLEISGQPIANATQLVVPTEDSVRVLLLTSGEDDSNVSGFNLSHQRITSVVPCNRGLWVLTGSAVSSPAGNNTHFATYSGNAQLWVPAEAKSEEK